MNVLQRIILVIFITFSIFSLAGCQSEADKKNDLMAQVSFTFFLGTIIYACAVFFGPSIAERARKRISDQFKLSKQDQIAFAKWLYWIGTLMTLILAYIFMPYFEKVLPIMLMLFGSTLYPFYVNVIGGIKTENQLKIKNGLVQIKSFVVLIIVLYVSLFTRIRG